MELLREFTDWSQPERNSLRYRGDSWRANASHIPELQFNMTVYNMKIDFGGLDRWDYQERVRNVNEAESG